ncbi:MAG TPA: molybdopterin-dependent oxidoreductase [Ktedonobacteraceae bacterium]|nr:molybdopterin-dependent oxidoreductase [Ktedonobacteraceae bacterium]
MDTQDRIKSEGNPGRTPPTNTTTTGVGGPGGRTRFRYGFVAGLAAGIVASIAMIVGSTIFGGISLPEEFGSEITALMPPPMFAYLHQLIGGDAKFYLFYIILGGQCLVFALSGGLYNLAIGSRFVTSRTGSTRTQLDWLDGVVLALALWLLTGFLLLPATGAGIFGAQTSIGLQNSMVSLGVVGLIFGLLFAAFQNWLVILLKKRGQHKATESEDEDDGYGFGLSRRALLKRGFIIAGIALLGVAAYRFISEGGGPVSAPVGKLVQNFKSKIVPPPKPNYGTVQPVRGLSSEITPNDQFYVVSKNLFSDPTINAAKWNLSVNGEVEHTLTFTYEQLLAMPMKKQYETLECISNDVGGPYISNALWEGIPLNDLLQRAGVKAGASKVVFSAADDYSDSIHLSKALEPTTLLAVRMNGAPLPNEHGFPVRMLVPGIYGMKHCKWLTDIEVVNTNYQGYWQQRGWSDAATVQIMSRIDTPLIGATLPANRPTFIAGVAFSGNKGISEVDVSLDDGQSWQRATLKRPYSDLTWVLWELPWTPKAGSYTIIVRAIDLEGNVQDPNPAPPLPNGATGYHTISVSVS